MGRGVRIYIEHRVCCLNLRVCLRFIPPTPKAPTVLFLAGKRDYCIRYHMSVEHQLVNADELIGHMHGGPKFRAVRCRTQPHWGMRAHKFRRRLQGVPYIRPSCRHKPSKVCSQARCRQGYNGPSCCFSCVQTGLNSASAALSFERTSFTSREMG